jgi:arabinan endo-1,5-alpha-L-arabinosidase
MMTVAAVLAAAFAAVAAGTVAAWPDDPAYSNPVLGNDAPDPAAIRAPDGTFYAYTTQSYHDAVFVNLPVLRSDDLVHWRLAGDALPDRPQWAVPGTDQGDIWAPHPVRWDGRYLLYFSARTLDPGTMAIGVATSDTPTGPFVDKGEPLVVGRGFVAIDPFATELPDGRRILVWGSDGAPIRAQELSPDGLELVGEPTVLLRPSGAEYEGLVEGAWLLEHGGWWYLMYSGDACCGPEAHYAVLVARSRSALGPYTKRGRPILAANETSNAPGHNSTIADADGRDWMLYHAMQSDDVTNVRYLYLDPIEWRDGWPVVNDGAGPSAESDEAPAVE